ncbi:TetR family transcriptional regulator [Antrihabitans stalactiti]|uniref:TetR/AcrR family transcriptional regulator n=1 Tax=Antrihabitans stalactiti TaxID=2584121 RepID=A0A848KNP2_9NOCA|nr:TetR/AcrR family transcriptional regulator [Antrihabitans stalactiti]
MAPPRKHDTDVILDAARALVLADGPRAASVAAIANASEAPAGTLYHRFGNRNGILTAAWLRALERFQTMAMASDPTDPLECAVAMAVASIAFTRAQPDDAKLLLLRPRDLLDGGTDDEFEKQRAAMNVPIFERLAYLARELMGSADERNLDTLARAVAFFPYAVVRWHVYDAHMPEWLEEDIARDVRALLSVAPR